MPDVMDERGGKDERLSFLVDQLGLHPAYPRQERPGDVHHTDRVGKPAMVGPRKNELADAKLLDPPQPLKLLGVDQIPEQTIARIILERNELVHWIPDDLGPDSRHKDSPLMISAMPIVTVLTPASDVRPPMQSRPNLKFRSQLCAGLGANGH